MIVIIFQIIVYHTIESPKSKLSIIDALQPSVKICTAPASLHEGGFPMYNIDILRLVLL